jgi:hypothetical protein
MAEPVLDDALRFRIAFDELSLACPRKVAAAILGDCRRDSGDLVPRRGIRAAAVSRSSLARVRARGKKTIRSKLLRFLDSGSGKQVRTGRIRRMGGHFRHGEARRRASLLACSIGFCSYYVLKAGRAAPLRLAVVRASRPFHQDDLGVSQNCHLMMGRHRMGAGSLVAVAAFATSEHGAVRCHHSVPTTPIENKAQRNTVFIIHLMTVFSFKVRMSEARDCEDVGIGGSPGSTLKQERNLHPGYQGTKSFATALAACSM